ncbi:MAG: NAD-dependent epimerase/dehydratase family protein [Candidatus Dormibacterales bacterium]
MTRALANDVPVIQVESDADDATLADAMSGIEVVISCAQTWSPSLRLRFQRRPPPILERVVAASQRSRVRRIVHVSTADVYGPDHFARINEKAKVRPKHAYERLKLFEETWLQEAAHDKEVVIVRPARIFGDRDDWMVPALMADLVRGRSRLPGGGRAPQTFVSADDVGRACLAAADRGRPGHTYLIGGFDSTWRDLLETAARAVGFTAEIGGIPYDVAFLGALARETMSRKVGGVWPGVYAVDVLGKPHHYDDSWSRRELTWSPSVGSFEQAMPGIAPWLGSLPEVAAALAAADAASAKRA